MSSVQDLDQLLGLILESAEKMVNSRASALLVLDESSNTLYFKAATGEKRNEVMDYRLEMGQGIAGKVAESGEPLLIPDVHQDPRWFREISESLGFDTRSLACVPMKLSDATIGVLQVIDKTDMTPFDDGDIKLLSEFAGLAALAIANARMIDRMKTENERLRASSGLKDKIIGSSPAIEKAIAEALKVAPTNTRTLILGESGTGKELLANLIHQTSLRKDKPLVVINCAALPETLLEDEFFGHEKGAFTGATNRKIGRFELAHEGTIFLDEIGEMSPGMQAKLLRVLEEGMLHRVGGTTPIYVDVRVLSATNRVLDEEVANGNFREDLFYRLNVVQIHMPPLRERLGDISALAEYFLNIFKKQAAKPDLTISKDALQKMIEYQWPGNIRELRNAMERAVVMGNQQAVTAEDLPIANTKPVYPGLEVGLSLKDAANRFRKAFITLNLNHAGGNRSKAAEAMGIQRTYLSRLIAEYGIRDI